MLYRYGVKNPVSDCVEWEFSFKKYLERNNIKNLDAVSLLLGANDLAPFVYEDTAESVKTYIENIRIFINSIREAQNNIDVIINLPIPGSEQSAFGFVMGCSGTYKAHSYRMREGIKAILNEFQDVDGVYICPMSHVIDTKNGFDKTTIKANLYNDNQLITKDDALHPNQCGYRQIGDALAGNVEMIRHRRKSKFKD